jgi:hypothetical protein
MTRTFWLSFVDPDKPEGQRLLGVAIVDVNDEEAAHAKLDVAARFPNAQPDAEWIAAATSRAWAVGCNPGGEIGFMDITGQPQAAHGPRDRLMQYAELLDLGLVARPS